MAKILTLEFETLKLNLRGNLFIFIEISNGGNDPLKLIYFKVINF